MRSHLRTLHTDLTPQPPYLLALGEKSGSPLRLKEGLRERSIHAITPGKLGMRSL
ncbi:MAG: hypothetical protein V7K21_04950 [Nostoc sp.]|uniref:hypothetical protein n=1 Tax=Nostoc sp. TaxID=1180 RepID=UPI002FF5946D